MPAATRTGSSTVLSGRGPRARAQRAPSEGLRRLTLLSATAVIVEASLYSALAPLLPHYRDALGLSKTAVGVLSAVYPAGVLVASAAGAVAAGRLGARRIVVVGFVVLAGASVVFGLAGNLVVLDMARAGQGVGAGLIWSGILVWLLAAVPGDRRGQALGSAMGAATLGTLFGPLVGALALSLGPAPAFGAVACTCLAVVVWVLRTPGPTGDAGWASNWSRASRDRLLLGLAASGLLVGAIFGMVNTMVPLRLDDAGFDELAVSATFLISAVVAGVVAPLIGWLSDRADRAQLVALGLLGVAPGLLLIGLAGDPLVIAGLTIVTFGVAVIATTVPLTALTTEVAERAGMTLGPIAGLVAVTLSGGEMLGAPATATAADARGDSFPFAVAAGVALLAMALILRGARRRQLMTAPRGS